MDAEASDTDLRPRNVVLFENTALASVLVSFAGSLLMIYVGAPGVANFGGPLHWIAFNAAFNALVLALVLRASRRRSRRARAILLLLTIVGTGLIIYDPSDLLSGGPLLIAMFILGFVLDCVALWLIYTGDARPWFGAARA